MAKKILITGANSLIGNRLSELLYEKGYEVAWLVRKKTNNIKYKTYLWNPSTGEIDTGCIDRTVAIIHLAGAGIIDKRWSDGRKQEIISSRTESIRLIYKALAKHKHQVTACISAGGIGYYGDGGENHLTEDSAAGNSFAAETCIQWEKAVAEGESIGLRISQLRTGMVLSTKGGALTSLEKSTKIGLGAPIGSGHQWLSWIHIDDLCRIYIRALETPSFTGIFNAVSPNPVRNGEFFHLLAKTMHKPILLPHVPAFIIRTVLGDRASLLLDSQRVACGKLLQTGFEFQYKLASKALENLYS